VTIAATRSIRRAALGTVLLTMALAGSAAAQTPPRELSLEEAIRLAHMYNPDYLAQEVQAERAAWANRQAWAGFLPTANVSQTLGYSASGERRFESVQLATQPGTYSSRYSFGINYSLSGATFLRPGLVREQNRATEAVIDGASAGLRETVTQAYLNVAQADARLAQARTELERTRSYVRQAEARVDVGAATPLDVRRTEVQLGQAEVQLLQAENAAATARLALSRVLGIRLADDVALTTRFEIFEPNLDVEQLLARALENNPVLRASRSRASAARAQTRVARTQYLPSLSVSANWSGSVFKSAEIDPLVADRLRQLSSQFESCVRDNRIRELIGDPARDCSPMDATDPAVVSEVRRTIAEQNTGFPFSFTPQPRTISLTVSLPIFNGFTRELQLQEARIAETAAMHQLRSEELRLRAEVETAVRAVQMSRQMVELQRRIRETAAEELRLANERYRLGLASSIEVVDAQTNLAQAERDEITAIFDFHRAIASLEALVGAPIR